MKPGDVVLIDTNVIIEGHLAQCWPALTGAFRIQTVEKCIEEAMTGRRDWQQTKPTEVELRKSFDAVHEVDRQALAEVLLSGGAMLHAGEQYLWAHALSRPDTWVLCGPDRASMRFGYEQNQRERLVSLGGLLRTINYTPKAPLRPHFQEDWLDELVRKLVLGLL